MPQFDCRTKLRLIPLITLCQEALLNERHPYSSTTYPDQRMTWNTKQTRSTKSHETRTKRCLEFVLVRVISWIVVQRQLALSYLFRNLLLATDSQRIGHAVDVVEPRGNQRDLQYALIVKAHRA